MERDWSDELQLVPLTSLIDFFSLSLKTIDAVIIMDVTHPFPHSRVNDNFIFT